MMKRWQSALLATSGGWFGFSATAANANVIAPYFQQNLVSDLSSLAPVVTDPNLKNPWGVSESSTSPLWVSDQNTSVSTLYTIQGLSATRAGGPLVVPIPTQPTPPNGPTGQVNNSTSLFLTNQSGTSAPAHFIFADLNGGIYAWAAPGTPAAVAVPPAAGTVYTGLAIGGASSSTPFLYAANVAQGRIDVFDGTFTNVTNTTFFGKFVDPSLPTGLVPFNVQTIGGFGGNIYVTYAPGGPPANQSGATIGQGAVAIFKPDGTFVEQLIAGTTNGSRLAAPWGIALAPADFGPLSGDLLVGNFAYGNLNGTTNPGGGEIDAYNPLTGAFIETLDSNVAWQGLWALTFGNGGSGGSQDILYFTTGLNSETDGLLAALAVPEPGTLALLGMGALSLWVVRRRRSGGADRFT
jgi:uncharacterized protein (TIGR03118 family)